MPRSDDEIIASLKTPDQCLALARNARERERPDLALRAERRAIEFRASLHGASNSAEQEALQAVLAYEVALTEKNGKNTRANRTWQAIKRHGVIKAVERIVLKREESLGYKTLVAKGLEDMCFEAVILRHPNIFSSEVQRVARERLQELQNLTVVG